MWLALSGLCAAVLSLAGIYLYLDPQVPQAESYRHVQLETPLRVYTADEKLIAEFGERRLIPITLDEVPDAFVSALLDTEDKRFYEHRGIDYISLTNDVFGLIGNLLTGQGLGAGASTITMQLARNISFSLERTFIRKFKEMLLALKIEQELSKDEILELYINVVPFGKRAYGAQAAALTYYGKTLKELNLPQLAMLAGIPQAPTAGNPINGPERALKRRNVVLRRMVDQGSISEADFAAALAAPITARLYSRELDVPAPFPAEWARQELIERFPDLYSGGYAVYTTLDAAKQRAASQALRTGLLGYDRRHGYRGPEDNVAEEDGTLSDAAIGQALAGRDSVAGLQPAVISAVDESGAVARLSGEREALLDLASVRWARAQIDVDNRGARVRAVSDVLSVGDVIRVQDLGMIPVEAETDEEQAPAEDAAAPPLKQGWRLAQLPEIQGALVSLDPHDGAVRALVGGFDFTLNQYNHALQAARQPGSGFKPFVYSAAIDHGITPASIFMDAPLVFEDANLESDYRPDNDNNRYNGPTRLREALYRSINLVSMRVLLEVGAGDVMDYVSQFGFDTSTFPRNTQLAIGGGTMAVTPVAMATAYAVIANGGYRITPHLIERVQDLSGDVVFAPRYPEVCDEACEERARDATDLLSGEPANLEELFATAPPGTEETAGAASTAEGGLDAGIADGPIPAPRVIDERNAYIMHSMLQDVIRKGTGRRARSLGRTDLAGKTGTTNDAADTWFNGYNPELVATVWVGFPNHQALGANEYGSTTPLPIWIDYMSQALAGAEEVFPQQPAGVVTMKIDPESGQLAAARRGDAIFELFLAEHTPRPPRTSVTATEDGEEDIKDVDIF